MSALLLFFLAIIVNTITITIIVIGTTIAITPPYTIITTTTNTLIMWNHHRHYHHPCHHHHIISVVVITTTIIVTANIIVNCRFSLSVAQYFTKSESQCMMVEGIRKQIPEIWFCHQRERLNTFVGHVCFDKLFSSTPFRSTQVISLYRETSVVFINHFSLLSSFLTSFLSPFLPLFLFFVPFTFLFWIFWI